MTGAYGEALVVTELIKRGCVAPHVLTMRTIRV